MRPLRILSGGLVTLLNSKVQQTGRSTNKSRLRLKFNSSLRSGTPFLSTYPRLQPVIDFVTYRIYSLCRLNLKRTPKLHRYYQWLWVSEQRLFSYRTAKFRGVPVAASRNPSFLRLVRREFGFRTRITPLLISSKFVKRRSCSKRSQGKRADRFVGLNSTF